MFHGEAHGGLALRVGAQHGPGALESGPLRRDAAHVREAHELVELVEVVRVPPPAVMAYEVLATDVAVGLSQDGHEPVE